MTVQTAVTERTQSAWHSALLTLGLIWVAILVLYWPTAQAMAAIWWRSETYAHGLIVLPASLWMAWRLRSQLRDLARKPAWLAVLVMAAAGILWLLGDLVAVNVVTQFALVTMLVFAVPAVLGWEVAKRLAFPLAFAYLAVPAGDFMMPQLMLWTADFTVAALRLSGIPVYREGLQFIIPSGSWSVVEACSGIRYLMASFTVGALFAYLNYQSIRKRVLFIGVAIFVPLLANWLRAYMIVMIGHWSGNELASGVDHLIYGWVFFGIVITIMFMIGARWADRQTESATPLEQANLGVSRAGNAGSWTVVAWVLVLVGVPHILNWHLQSRVNHDPVQLMAIQPKAPWAAVAPHQSWVPAYEQANAMSHAAWLSQSGLHVGAHVAYYRDQSYDRKLISSTNVLVKSQDESWARLPAGASVTAESELGRTVFSTAVLRKQSSSLVADSTSLTVWQAYWVDEQLVTSPMRAKLLGAWQKIKGHGDDGAIVALYTEGVGEEADRTLRAFWRDQAGTLVQSLRATQQQQ